MKLITIKAVLVFFIVGVQNIALAFSGADDLIKMARSGVDEEVLQSYIQSSSDTYDLSAEDIITLKDLGVSSKVISEALRHGTQIDSAAAHATIKEASNDTGEMSPLLSTSAAVAPPADKLNISFFYEALYPYGNWVMIDGEWCWQPNATVINEDWAPYCDRGHWIYSDWGWCWVSDYSWGWAPFHYGRWFRHQHNGWCWVPDADWGPAWVAWRSGNGYCGWAPLPPHSRYSQNGGVYFGADLVGNDFEFNLSFHEYRFLPIGHFDDPHPWRHSVVPGQAEEVFGKTSFIRNSHGFDHGHIFNRGLPVDEISKTNGRTIRSIAVVQEAIHPGQPIERGMVKKNRFLIYKPSISPAVPETPEVIASRYAQGRTGIESQNKAGANREKQRREFAVQAAVKNERFAVEAAQRERAALEQAARGEADMKKRAELQRQAEARTMRAQQANDHVERMMQHKEPEVPAPVPRSRVIPAPSPDDRERINRQIQAQVHEEARMERQRGQSTEDMSGRGRVAPENQQRPAAPVSGRGGTANTGDGKKTRRER